MSDKHNSLTTILSALVANGVIAITKGVAVWTTVSVHAGGDRAFAGELR